MDMSPSTRAKIRPFDRVEAECLKQSRGKLLWIIWRNQPARSIGTANDRLRFDRLRRRPDPGCDNRATHRLGFHRRPAECFRLRRRHDSDVSREIGGGNVVNMTDQVNTFAKAGCRYLLPEASNIPVASLCVPRQHDMDILEFVQGICSPKQRSKCVH